MENDLHRKRENLCLYFLMISSIRAHVSLWFYCALDGRCFSLLFLFFFSELRCFIASKNEEWRKKYHRRMHRTWYFYGFTAPPKCSSNFDNLLPNTQAFDIYLLFFDSISISIWVLGFGRPIEVLLSESKSVFLSTSQPCCLGAIGSHGIGRW